MSALRRRLAWLGVSVLVVAWFVARPVLPHTLAGQAIYVSTHGTSMLPRFHAGDLALVRPDRSYSVGQVAAYRSVTLRGATVLHRIVAIHHGVYTFKGDHNTWLDPDHPTRADLIGTLRFRVPRGGRVHAALVRPIVLVPVVLVLLLAGSGASARRRKRRRRGVRLAEPEPAPRARPGVRATVLPAAAAVAVAAVAAAALWSVPATHAATETWPVSETARLSYSARVAPGAAYPTGRVLSNEPVFTRLVDRLDVALDGRVAAGAPLGRVTRVVRLRAVVGGTAGWERSVPLGIARITGRHATAHASFDVRLLRLLESQLALEAGGSVSATSVSLRADVRTVAMVAGEPVTLHATPRLDLQLSSVALTRATAIGGSASPPSATASASVPHVVREPRVVRLWRVRLSVDAARRWALAVLGPMVLAAFVSMRIGRGRRRRSEAEKIVARYGRMIVSSDGVRSPEDRPVVRVQSADALAQLAARAETVVVRSRAGRRERFSVFTPAVVYEYEIAAVTPDDDRAAVG
jgi:hypothetical protein